MQGWKDISRVGGPYTCLIPEIQIRGLSNHPKCSRINMNTVRTKSTSKGKEAATWKKVGSVQK